MFHGRGYARKARQSVKFRPCSSLLLPHAHFARRHMRICLTRNTMAVVPEIDRRFRPKEPNETNPAAAGPDNVDSLVFDFLQELKGLSVEAQPVQPAKVEAEKPSDNLPVFQAVEAYGNDPLEPVAFKEEVVSGPELDVAAIDKEIDATLAELETPEIHRDPDKRPQGFHTGTRIHSGKESEATGCGIRTSGRQGRGSADRPQGRRTGVEQAGGFPDGDRIFQITVQAAQNHLFHTGSCPAVRNSDIFSFPQIG